jgi:hypothetical protein
MIGSSRTGLNWLALLLLPQTQCNTFIADNTVTGKPQSELTKRRTAEHPWKIASTLKYNS